ncbi:NUDIX hydrolase [Rhodococcus antarcticus]|nr:NUDIX hydrolase [Rhodococcus antarcticus]
MPSTEPDDGVPRPAPGATGRTRPSAPSSPDTAVPSPGRRAEGRRVADGRDPRHGGRARMRTVDETSAGGLVVRGLDGPPEHRTAALIGRTDRRGRLLWSLPKGHLEEGETAVQAAEREVQEETGILGRVLTPLGDIDYWFVTEGRRVHKTVHHFLLRHLGGELCDEDVEVTEVAWVPLAEMDTRLAYADERRLVQTAHDVISRLGSSRDGDATGPGSPGGPSRS